MLRILQIFVSLILLFCPYGISLFSQEAIPLQRVPSALLSTNSPIINTRAGPIQGFQQNGVNKYFGIPYAEPPIGNNRWRATIPKRSWTQTLRTTNYSAMCIQPTEFDFGLGTSEDCLYLNVFSPTSACEETKLPVIFWIHGGSYLTGSGNLPVYDGSSLATKSNVVVTINYRLGVFGFFGLSELREEDTHHSTGNYGLNDMQVALQWVQDNISKFGGDKTKVTIWGESAGCEAVLANLAAKQSSGLFARAICDSGGYGKVVNTLEFVYKEGKYVANKTNCLNDSRGVLACLRSKSAESLSNIFSDCTGTDVLPTIDNYQFTDSPYNLIGTSHFNHVPLLYGANHDEGSLLLSYIIGLPMNLSADEYADAFGGVAEARGYTSANVPSLLALYPLSNYASPFWGISDFFGDIVFICPTITFLKKYSQTYPTLPLYSYSFNYNQSLYIGLYALGATHTAELDFVFQGNFTIFQSPSNSAQLKDEVQTYWRAFAKNGNVNSLNHGSMRNWPLYKYPGSQQNIVLDTLLGVEKNLGKDARCNALQSIRPFVGLGPNDPSCQL